MINGLCRLSIYSKIETFNKTQLITATACHSHSFVEVFAIAQTLSLSERQCKSCLISGTSR